MTTTHRAAILADLEQYAPTPNLKPGEFTKNDIAEQHGITPVRATLWARRMVKDGVLEEFARYDPRIAKQVNAWRPVGGGSCTESDEKQPIGYTDDMKSVCAEIIPDSGDFDDPHRIDPDELRPADEEGDVIW